MPDRIARAGTLESHAAAPAIVEAADRKAEEARSANAAWISTMSHVNRIIPLVPSDRARLSNGDR
jgi:hypothetical protein